MFCSKCGTQNSDTNTTCVNCGAVLKRAEELGYTPQPQQYQPYPTYAEMLFSVM